MDERRELIDLLVENARYSIEDLARQTGLKPAAVEDEIATLEDERILRGYQAVVDWSQVDDQHVRAEVELNVALDRETSYADIARRIAKFPEVTDLRLVSGEYDFAVAVEGASMHTVSDFVADRIAPIPEITQTVTHFVMATYKDRGIEFERTDSDDRLSVSP